MAEPGEVMPQAAAGPVGLPGPTLAQLATQTRWAAETAAEPVAGPEAVLRPSVEMVERRAAVAARAVRRLAEAAQAGPDRAEK